MHCAPPSSDRAQTAGRNSKFPIKISQLALVLVRIYPTFMLSSVKSGSERKKKKTERERERWGEKETRQERMAIWRRRCVRIGARSFDDEERERESWQGDTGRKRDRLCARHGAAWKEVRDTDVTLDLEARRVQAQTYLAAISHHPPCVSVSPSLLPLPFLSSGASTSLFGGLARGCGFRYRGR